MLLLPGQTYENEEQALLSIMCAECRFHFQVKTYRARTKPLDSTIHPSHMLIPFPFPSSFKSGGPGTAEAGFICAVKDCFFVLDVSVAPPKLTTDQINMLRDDDRIFRNLQLARIEDPQRYADISDNWGAGTGVPTLAQYIEDRLSKPSTEVLKIKKRNKRFCVAFGKDFDDLLRSLGFEDRLDDEGEECWYITEPEPIGIEVPCPVNTRRAHLQDTLEELRSLSHSSVTLPAWKKLMETFPSYLPRHQLDMALAKGVSDDDIALLGCLKEFSPPWFSWAAILLAGLCPSRRDVFLDAGLRCIQERNEEASLNIIMYRSQFDQVPSLDPQVRAAFEFFDISPEDAQGTHEILEKYRDPADADASGTFLSEASRCRDIIARHVASVAPTESGAASDGSLISKPRRMSIRSASRLLSVDSSFTAELMRDFAVNASERGNRVRIVEALEVFSDLKESQGLHSEAQSLKETADFLRETGIGATGQQQDSLRHTQSLAAGAITHMTTPPGLKNIGNTCYLNSLLQYFYNVKPIRDMVLDYDHFQLGLDDASVNGRQTGGNGTPVTLEEAIVARQFVEELRSLFSELQTTTGTAASPSQKLANTALSSAKEILTSKNQNQPPPLPARPSPAPPTSLKEEQEISTVNTTVEPINVEPINELRHVASSDSTQTLVNEPDDQEPDTYVKEQFGDSTIMPTDEIWDLNHGSTVEHVEDANDTRETSHGSTIEHLEDVTMEDSPPFLALEQKISQISQRLEKSERSGTSQQDVEEIIGNILEHLMRAIRPDGPMAGKPGLQADKITELFFTTIVNSTMKKMSTCTTPTSASSVDEDILNEEVVPERWITAFPHPDKERKVKNTLYEALDGYFSYELLSEGSLARYTSIRALPPIVHICIQRTDASGVKNRNPVIIPEELYLDRYMEAAAGSDLWNARRRVWAVKERINELELRASNTVESVMTDPGSLSWNTYSDPPTNYQGPIELKSELWSDVPLGTKRTSQAAQLSQETGSNPSKRRSISDSTENRDSSFVRSLWEAGRRMDEVDSSELASLRSEQANTFNAVQNHKYCLHAMICHGGGMNAGHYWVWVRDFKNQIWYKYNDSQVTKDSRDSQQVISEVNNSGDPYYVAYVRDELKDDLVEVPPRAQREDDDVLMDMVEEELEVIDSIPIDTPPQPANSPANTPVPEALMGDVLPLELQA
ncbi:cysteine proteinase [Nemania sp. NC0429]|nr:cysteine proteinase [Nemania sp. NC0429]